VPYYVSIGGTDRVRAIVDGSQTLLTKYDYDALAKPTQTFVSGAVSVPSIVADYLFDSEVGLLLSGALNVIDTGLGRYLPKMGEVRRGLHAATIGSDFHPTFGQTQDKTAYWSPEAGSMFYDPSVGPYLRRNAYHPFWADDAEQHFSHRAVGGHGAQDDPNAKPVDLLSKWNTSGQLQAMFHGYLSEAWLAADTYRDLGYHLPDVKLEPETESEDFFLYVHPLPAPPQASVRRVLNWQQLTGDEVAIILYKHISRETTMGSWVEAGQTIAHTRRHLTLFEAYYEPHVHIECQDWWNNTYTLFYVSRFYQTYPVYVKGGWEVQQDLCPGPTCWSEEMFFLNHTVPALRKHGWGQECQNLDKFKWLEEHGYYRDGWEWEAESGNCAMGWQGYDQKDIPCFGEGAMECYDEHGREPFISSEDGGECYCDEDRCFWYYIHNNSSSQLPYPYDECGWISPDEDLVEYSDPTDIPPGLFRW